MKYTPIDLLDVSMNFSTADFPVGRIALQAGQIWFEYDPAFIDRGLDISPFNLKLKSGAVSGKLSPFEGLFGVFNDSLPDGWGKLLLDRAVRSHGIAHESLTPLDRLSHVGASGMGALVYRPAYAAADVSSNDIDLDAISHDSQLVLEGAAEDLLEELYALGGSSAGARPKILVGYDAGAQKIIHGQRILSGGYAPWMIKFRSSNDPSDISAIEYAYALMARAAGLDMPEARLFNGKKGDYFGVRRFDRNGTSKFHVHTASGLLHADHRLPSLDYEGLLRASLLLCRDIQEVEKLFRLAVFNVFAHNRDDHAKNFSFLMGADGQWKVAPAYDLTFSYGPGREHSTTIMGEGKNPGTAHLLKLAEKFGLKNAAAIIEQVKDVVSNWAQFSKQAGVTKESGKIIWDVFEKTLSR